MCVTPLDISILWPAVYWHFFHLCFSQHSTHTPLSAAKLTWINFSIKISWDSVKCFTKNPNICQLPYWDFFWFYLFDFFFSHSFCLKLILHTKTSTTLPCLDHFGLVLVKSRSVCVCPKPTQLRVCRTWKDFSLLPSAVAGASWTRVFCPNPLSDSHFSPLF